MKVEFTKEWCNNMAELEGETSSNFEAGLGTTEWKDRGPFTAVAIRQSSANGPLEIFARMPERTDLNEAKLDLICFNKQCQCNNPKNQPRATGCMRNYPRPASNGFGYLDYIDNADGFRALPYKV